MSTESPVGSSDGRGVPDITPFPVNGEPRAPFAPSFTQPESLQTFLAELLADQQRLQTPAARAAAIHEVQPAAFRGERFRDLIPLTAPGPGEQYAFEVDLDACSGCKACVAGCHSLNGLDENETWRDVGLVLGGAPDHPFQQTVTTACHHCADPACLNGCPVLAYEKDPVTGIVRHLDDQCIGCSYCVLKCPYDVPKYNERLGIVRKCDMCHGRLAEGEAPACVQACPTQAIAIVKVATFSSETTAPNPQLAALSSTDSSYTRPTTRYVSKRELPARLRPADADTLRPQHAHLALIFLLTGTQLGLGLMIAALLPGVPAWIAGLGWAFFFAGLVASIAHLGQPFRAWRVFLNLRKSWLSREAIVLGHAFAPLSLYVAVRFGLLDHLPPPPSLVRAHLPEIVQLTGWAGAVFGLLGVFCSGMIYADTRRVFWRPAQSLGRMLGTVLVAALTFTAPVLAAAVLAAKLALELVTLRGSSHPARLQRGPLLMLLSGRLLAGGFALAFLIMHEPVLAFVWLVLGELAERTLFFRAVDSPKMPGVPAV
ncbi:MAG: dimethyl sulfoxide reductase anchor subunit [Verrucomicrobia bacterium]|nr:dimethyl sulfoxide reductase anchor subunit [Verrucomicrobiota bacterium]